MKKSKASQVVSGPSKKEHDQYQAKDDLRTLTRAEEIRADKGRMSNVRHAHEEEHETLVRVGRSITGREPKKGRRRRGRGRRGRR
jgi:hypothetical protein